MDFIGSDSCRSACTRRPWQKSMDSQEFGFASSLITSKEVAPADELFFKGQLLPLQMDPRLHLVQALSCEQASAASRGAAPLEEEGIEYNSCRMEPHEGVHRGSEDETAAETASRSARGPREDLNCAFLEHAPSEQISLQRELSVYSWCKGEELLSCTRVEGAHMGLDTMATDTRDYDSRPSLDQTCDQVGPRSPAPQSAHRRSEEIKGPWQLSYWGKDEEISFHSCRMEGNFVDVDIKAQVSMADLRSLSFRSQNSGFWESGVDKDTGDSSSSSRDSNGSSQDSYCPNSTSLETRSCASAAHSPHAKASFGHILWKSLLKKASNKATSSSPPISRMSYSEDLSKYKPCSRESKEAMLQWKLDTTANAEKSREKQDRKSKSNSSNDGSKSGLISSKSVLCNAAKEDVIAHTPTATLTKSLISKGKGGRDDEKLEEMKRKQRSAAASRGKWQGYASRLRPLYDMKKGLMGQFRMNECGKRACVEVESGNIYAATSSTTPAMQRRFSHEVCDKLIMQEQNQVMDVHHPHMKGSSNMRLAMSSCPPTTRSSPSHSGVLAVIGELKHVRPTSTSTAVLQSAHGTKKTNISKDSSTKKFGISATQANKNGTKATSSTVLPSSNYSSMSTMHELHSALQSAIAHCKESNKRLDFPA